MLASAFLALLPVLAAAAPQYGAAYSTTDSYAAGTATASYWETTAYAETTAPSEIATTTTSATTSAETASGTPIRHTVVVGGDTLTYTPNFVNAAIGDLVVFEFHAKNHTATQSSFASPCTYLAGPNGESIGLDSGFVPVAANATVFPSWAVTVTVSTPLWFYCRQGNHCAQGMGFGINPPAEGNTIDAFILAQKGTAAAPPTWTETATPKWTGSGVAAAFSTGVSQIAQAQVSSATTTARAAIATASSTSGAGKLGAGVALAVVGAAFALVA